MKGHTYFRLLVLAALSLSSCEVPGSKKPEPESRSTTTIIQHPDSALYTPVCYQFYRNEHGNIFEQNRIFDMDSNGNHITIIFYDSSYFLWDDDAGIHRRIPIETVMDIDSYMQFPNSSFAKDKRHVYYAWGTSDGERRAIIEGADKASFQPLADYRWARDRRYVYYTTFRVEGADARTIDVLHPADTTNPFINYVRDHRHVFYQGEIVAGADPRSFRLVVDSAWDARDNKNRYRDGKIY